MLRGFGQPLNTIESRSTVEFGFEAPRERWYFVLLGYESSTKETKQLTTTMAEGEVVDIYEGRFEIAFGVADSYN